jgi:cleavage stimulation factor subunit 2|eukprot:g6507.t1
MSKESSVFVGNIVYNVTEAQVRELMGEVGPVVKVTMVIDRGTGQHKGYGFCQYMDQATAQSAIRNLNGRQLNGREIRVSTATSNGNSSRGGGAAPAPAPQQHRAQQQQQQQPTESLDELIKKSLDQLTVHQLYDCVKQMKILVDQKPDTARKVLMENPALAQAMLQAQWRLGMVRADPTGRFPTIDENSNAGNPDVSRQRPPHVPPSLPPAPGSANAYGQQQQQGAYARPPRPPQPMGYPQQPNYSQPRPLYPPGQPAPRYPGQPGMMMGRGPQPPRPSNVPPRPPATQYPPALIQQALSLTEAQINTLAPAQRQALLTIRQQHGAGAGGAPPRGYGQRMY